VLKKNRMPQECVRGLADLAHEFMQEAPDHRNQPEKLNELVQTFQRLGDNLVDQAKQIPLAEQPVVLRPVAARLRGIESNASRQAEEWSAAHARSAGSLRRIAAVARDVERKLTELIRQAAA
jgi:hypothetical protein